ncbi:MAG: class I SAM-dependent methyltransferase [Chloroflexi bacterium]|nr:class I SAM-dependent methyltransferase [Chloroflexota bacterium]
MIAPHDLPTPNKVSAQISAYDYAAKLARRPDIRVVLDLGCGLGHTRKFFQNIAPDLCWCGIDIPHSREVSARTETSHIVTYDGLHAPFKSEGFDLVYSRQVMEHVRHPEAVLAEVHRLLRPGGHFIGSTSHLEPYHSRSYWNYTPWGFCRLLEDAGFQVQEIRPGIDGLTLMLRSMLGHPRWFDRFFERESPLNWLFAMAGKIGRKSPRTINHLKLRYCGHFVFWAVKSGENPSD